MCADNNTTALLLGELLRSHEQSAGSGYVRSLCAADEFRESHVYSALVDHRFKASFGLLSDIFIHYSTSAVSGEQFSPTKQRVGGDAPADNSSDGPHAQQDTTAVAAAKKRWQVRTSRRESCGAFSLRPTPGKSIHVLVSIVQ